LNQVSAEVPSTATSVAGKASARPELENSQDPKGTRTEQDFLQRKLIIEPHFFGRKSRRRTDSDRAPTNLWLSGSECIHDQTGGMGTIPGASCAQRQDQLCRYWTGKQRQCGGRCLALPRDAEAEQ